MVLFRDDEYLGFESYGGEQGDGAAATAVHAGFARPWTGLEARAGGFDYELDRDLIHNRPHSYSSRFTDKLIDVVGMPVRAYREELTPLHEDFAFEAQTPWNDSVPAARSLPQRTGLRNLVIGVGAERR